MPLILAIEPDRKQAEAVAALARGVLRSEVIVTDSADAALAILARRTPDLLLTSLLLPPKDEAKIADRLRALDSGGRYIQTLVIPMLASSGKRSPDSKRKLWKSKAKASAPDGCAPEVFASQISEYLRRAAESSHGGLQEQPVLRQEQPVLKSEVAMPREEEPAGRHQERLNRQQDHAARRQEQVPRYQEHLLRQPEQASHRPDQQTSHRRDQQAPHGLDQMARNDSYAVPANNLVNGRDDVPADPLRRNKVEQESIFRDPAPESGVARGPENRTESLFRSRTESVHTEWPRAEAPRTESPHTEWPRPESPRTESLHTESPRTAPSRADSPIAGPLVADTIISRPVSLTDLQDAHERRARTPAGPAPHPQQKAASIEPAPTAGGRSNAFTVDRAPLVTGAPPVGTTTAGPSSSAIPLPPAPGIAAAGPAQGVTRPAPGTTPAPPMPGTSTSRPVSGTTAARPAPGTTSAPPVPGTAATRPAPGTTAARPGPGTTAARPVPGTSGARPASGTTAPRTAPGIIAARPASGTTATRPAPATNAARTAPGIIAARPAQGATSARPAPAASTDPAASAATVNRAPASDSGVRPTPHFASGSSTNNVIGPSSPGTIGPRPSVKPAATPPSSNAFPSVPVAAAAEAAAPGSVEHPPSADPGHPRESAPRPMRVLGALDLGAFVEELAAAKKPESTLESPDETAFIEPESVRSASSPASAPYVAAERNPVFATADPTPTQPAARVGAVHAAPAAHVAARAQTVVAQPASQAAPGPAAPGPAADQSRHDRAEKPRRAVQDEWGIFDPQQAGFAALFAKLEEITEQDETPTDPPA